MIIVKSMNDGGRFLSSTDWEGYEKILEAFDGRRVKITFDQGALELVSPSRRHERIKKILAELIEFACFEKGVDYFGGGSTTFKRKALERGLEPDECYYFHSLDAEEEAEALAPDLAIEVEVSRGSLDRLAIYAALGVSEIWCYSDDHKLIIHAFDSGGYSEAPASRFLPFLLPEVVSRFVQRGLERRNTRLLLMELREHLGSGPL